MRIRQFLLFTGILLLLGDYSFAGEITVSVSDNAAVLQADGQAIAVFETRDPEVARPYFKDLKLIQGPQLTRNYPPHAEDPQDHATFHPGLWLAFGDVNGQDYWRNKSQVRSSLATPGGAAGAQGAASFTTRNQYMAGEKMVCQEACRYTLQQLGDSSDWMLISDSTFSPDGEPVVFGDQEEMGFGVRVATPITVKNGGRILNSEGAVNEAGVWGKQADWADYSGTIDGRHVGITLMAHPDNFRKSWFHARDYGLLVANPFGQNAFTKGEKSQVVVKPGETLRLRFAAYLHSEADGGDEALKGKVSQAYSKFVKN